MPLESSARKSALKDTGLFDFGSETRQDAPQSTFSGQSIPERVHHLHAALCPDGQEIEIGRAHQWSMTGGAHVDWNTTLPDGGLMLPAGCSISYTLYGYQIAEAKEEIGVTGKGKHKQILYKTSYPNNGEPLNFEVGMTFFYDPAP